MAGTHVSPVRADSEEGIDPVRALLLRLKVLFEHVTKSREVYSMDDPRGRAVCVRIHEEVTAHRTGMHSCSMYTLIYDSTEAHITLKTVQEVK